MRKLLAGLGIVASTISASAQQPTFRARTQEVPLFVTVADAQRRLVPDLMREDFEIFDNDRPQPIVSFDNTPQPITVIVMLDTSGSMTGSISRLKDAAEQFLLRLLPKDRGRVGAFNDKIQISSRFTGDRDELISDAKDLDFGNGTRLWDAAMVCLDEFKTVEGRKVVLLFTDGDDTESRTKLSAVIDRARTDDVMFYTVGLESVYASDGRMVRSRPDSGLRKIADETGGGYFELKKSDDLAPTFTRVAQELHSQYVMGFAAPELDGKVHRVSVRVKTPMATARTRRTYLAIPDKDK